MGFDTAINLNAELTDTVFKPRAPVAFGSHVGVAEPEGIDHARTYHIGAAQTHALGPPVVRYETRKQKVTLIKLPRRRRVLGVREVAPEEGVLVG